MIEHEDDLPDDDEDALWDISERIGPLEPATLDAAEMEESARRIAAVLAGYRLRFRTLVEAVKWSATSVYILATGIFPQDPDPGYRMSDEEALAQAVHFFDAIMRALEDDALRQIPHDDEAFCPLCLASPAMTGTLGQRLGPSLLPH